MISRSLKLMAVIAVAAATLPALAGDVKITIPARSKLSPVQRLNRDGVEAVNKRHYQKAEELFYRAYLYDPNDPFTLNNLGFIAEQQGQLDRAHKFYQLASEQGCNAPIDLSSSKSLLKKPMTAALDGLGDLQMRVNRMNVEAMRLLSQDRAFEAVALLQQALALDARNPFTLNNLGVAEESIGDAQAALTNYNAAAASRSTEPVLVTIDHAWSGKPVSDMAAASAKRLQKRLGDQSSNETQAAMLNMRGVYAANANDWSTAKQNFSRAYSLAPESAFSLNNRAYIAEQEGDLESAQFFYEKARRANDAGNTVGVATEHLAEGRALFSVAAESNRKVDGALNDYSRQRHSQSGAIELTPRGEGASSSPTQQPQP
ncbi:MAG TPA: tetratricopeptide repeat protein [Terracidiphilus sp.]|nr:tetratricopeptide repeat protein [Terracidiphilus sp.]